MGRIITIVSGKGGVGKTTTAINLGMALNNLDKQVIVVDANLNTPNIGLNLGAPIVPVSLNHVLKGKADIEEAIYEHESGTKIVPSSLSIKEVKGYGSNKLPTVTQKLSKISDFVILDSAAGFGEEAISTMKAADEVIVVTNPEIPAVTDALKAVKIAKELGKDVKGVIITRYTGANWEMTLESIQSMLEIPIIGIVPEDKKVKQAVNRKNAVVHTHPHSRVSRKYHHIARKVAGHKEEEKSFLDAFKFWEY